MTGIPALNPAELECLDRLVEKGEMLMPERFSVLRELVRIGYAEVEVADWHGTGVALVLPTDEGRRIVLWRKEKK